MIGTRVASAGNTCSRYTRVPASYISLRDYHTIYCGMCQSVCYMKFKPNPLINQEVFFMSKKEKRCVWYDLQRSYYYDTHDKDGNFTGETEDQWKDRIRQEWRYDNPDIQADFMVNVFHTRDVEPQTGDPKGLHAHSLCHLLSGKTPSAMMAAAKCTRLQSCAPVSSIAGSARYLIHVSEAALKAKKTIYLPDETWVSEAQPGRTRLADLMAGKADDKEARDAKDLQEEWASYYSLLLMRGEWTLDMVKQAILTDEAGVGFIVQDWQKRRAVFEKDEEEYIAARTKFYIADQHQRGLALVYIEGKGGDGKTTLANALAARWADRRGVHLVAAPGGKTTFDFAGTYRGEKVSLFNEVGGSDFSPDQFCAVFDPKYASSVNSRNTDKAWTANYCIVTTSRDFEGFIRDAWLPYAKQHIRGDVVKAAQTDDDWDKAYLSRPDIADKIRQIRRRFAIRVLLSGGQCYVYMLNEACNEARLFDRTGYEQGREPYVLKLYGAYNPNDPQSIAFAVQAIDDVVHEYYSTYGYTVTPWMEDGFPAYLDELVGEAEEPAIGLRKPKRRKKTVKVEKQAEKKDG